MATRALGTVLTHLIEGIAWSWVLLPGKLRLFCGALLGRLLLLFSFREKIVEQNLEYAFPGTDSATLEKRATIKKNFYSHFGCLILEILMVVGAKGPMRYFIRNKVVFKNAEIFANGLAQGKGVIGLGSHLGNWEVIAASGSLLHGFPLLMVTKHLKPEWIHKAIEAGRASCRLETTHEPKTLKAILAQLKKKGGVCLVLDQYTGPPVGIRVPFFGIPVGTHTVVAMVAKRTGATVVPSFPYRMPDGTYVIEFGEPLPWQEDSDPHRELALNTARYVAEVEKYIRLHPEQWLWTHRRFKGDLSPLKDSEWTEGRVRS